MLALESFGFLSYGYIVCLSSKQNFLLLVRRIVFCVTGQWSLRAFSIYVSYTSQVD